MTQAAKDLAKSKAEAPQVDVMPDGFTEGGTPEVDGWYKPELGSTVHGKIVGMLDMKGSDGNSRRVILVKLRKACLGYQTGSEKGELLEPGSVLGVGVSYDLREALQYVTNKGEVWIMPLEKKKLPGNKTMWKFKQGYKGVKAAPPETSETRSDTADDDDIPF